MLQMMVLFRYRDRRQGSLDLYMKQYLLIILVSIEDDIKVPMADEDASFEEVMSRFFSQFFNTIH